MVKVKKDLTGQTFGRLTVLKQAEDYVNPKGRHYARWLCQCSCGSKPFSINGYSLTKRNGTKSCGCLIKETLSKNNKRYNTYDLVSQDYGIGYTSKGEEFWFDKEDYDLIRQYCWLYSKNGYLFAKEPNNDSYVYLHRIVMQVDDNKLKIDHRNHPPRNEHKFDNRKSNLKVVTNSENSMNSALSLNNTSGVTGVSYSERYHKWEAYITVNQKRKYLGRYLNKDDAINARKTAEIEYFKDNRYDLYN